MTRVGQSSCCLLLSFVVVLVWNRVVLVSARPQPSSLTDATPSSSSSHLSNNLPTQDDLGVMEELKEKILEDLGFAEFPSNLTMISDQEYLRAYREYMTNVQERRFSSRPPWKLAKERRKKATFRLHTFLPRSSSSSSSPDQDTWTFTFPRSRILLKAELQIRNAIIHMPRNCQIDRGSNSSSSFPRMDVTEDIVSWRRAQRKLERNNEEEDGREQQDWSISMTCLPSSSSSGVNSNQDEEDALKNSRLEVLCMKRAGGGNKPNNRVRRDMRARLRVSDFEDSVGGDVEETNKDRRLGRRRAKDCAELKHGKSCCRKSLKVSFEELRITEVILAPVSFDMGTCDGRCSARRLPYASNHAIFQRMISLNNNNNNNKVGKAGGNNNNNNNNKLCCSPTKLSEVDVIQRDPRRQDQLKVTVIHNAKVEECGCS